MAAILFIILNIFDAWLTSASLAIGAAESNPLTVSFGASLWAKGLIAATVIVGLYLVGKERLLWWANFAFLGIVVWNLQTMGIQNLLSAL